MMFKKYAYHVLFLLANLLAPVWFFAGSIEAQEHVRILSWNDFHASNQYEIVEDEKGKYRKGGAALLKGAIEHFRTQTIPIMAINAGDDFQGTPISSISRGKSQIDLLNRIQPDIFTPGNHEFDYGSERLDSLLQQATFPVICSNLWDKKEGALFCTPYRIENLSGVRIGFLGLITPALPNLVLRKHIKDIKVLEPSTVVRKHINMFKDSIDICVIASHMGIESDRKLAASVRSIDVIIGGHSHTAMEAPEMVNGVLIFQAGSYGDYLGKLELWVDTELDTVKRYRGELLSVNSRNFAMDSTVQTMVDSLERIVNKDLSEVIAELKTDWIRSRYGESNIGNWIADAFRDCTGADIAFQNSGGIRKNLEKGLVTKRDIWEISPFGNTILTFIVSGKELVTIMEKNVRGNGGILQVSGIKVWYDPNKPADNKIQKIRVNGKPVVPDKKYTIATNNYVFDHFYEYFGIPRNNRKVTKFEKLDREVLIDAAKRQKIIQSSKESRIQVVH